MNEITAWMKDFLKEEDVEIFNNEMKEFSNLKDDEEVMVVLNPVGVENLYIQTCDAGAVLAFGNWRQEYDNDAEGMTGLKEDVEKLLTNETYIWSVSASSKLIVSWVDGGIVRYPEHANEMGLDYMSSKPFLAEVAEEEGKQDFLFWNPNMGSCPSPKFFVA